MKVLPFYTATGMRDAERVSSWEGLLSPDYKLLPFQIQRPHVANTYLSSLALVDCDGAETDIFDDLYSTRKLLTGWTNAGYEGSFASSGSSILTAIVAAGAEAWCYSNEFLLATGQGVRIDYDLTLNAGVAPTFYLGKSDGTIYSVGTVSSGGANTDFVTAFGNDAGSVRLLVQNESGNNTDFSCTFSALSRNTLELSEFTTYDFITYKGTPLSDDLAYGVYYLKTSDGNTTWYSEWFSISKLQADLQTSWVGNTYDTFTTSFPSLNITNAIQIGASAAAAGTNGFPVRAGEKITYTYDFESISGVFPAVSIYSSSNILISNSETLVEGLNTIELTVTGTNAAAYLRISTTLATRYTVYGMSTRRKAGEYIHLEYTNSRDFNNGDESIYYADGFTQQAYLDTRLGPPTHEPIEFGDEKNGVFQAEKIVSKYVYNFVAYESPAMFAALRLLPLHDTIKILDRAGIEYTPSVGNLTIDPDWSTFDTGSMRISFNEDGVVWTNNMDAIT